MNQPIFDGPEGLERIKAHMRAAYSVFPRGSKCFQVYARGWLYGLFDAGGASDSVLMGAQYFIGGRGYELPSDKPVNLYAYPGSAFSRVEGKTMGDLEDEILAGGPHRDSRVARTYALASDPTHPLHFVAKHHLFLSRAWQAIGMD